MAFTTGTALGHNALMDALKTFLLAQSWTVEKEEIISDERYVYFKGPDILTGTVTINAHINIKTFQDVPADYYNWEMSAAIGFDTNEDYYTQPQVSPHTVGGTPTMPLFQNNIDYWFYANNRRFVVKAKVSTVFVGMHGGFLLGYGTPSEYPYPVYIGATIGTPTKRFSETSHQMGGFYDPSAGSAYVRHTDGSWLTCANYSGGSTKIRSGYSSYIWPYRDTDNDVIINNRDASYTLLPTVILSPENDGNVYGEIEGVFAVSGFANASENTITEAGQVYDVFQNSNRADIPDYVCVRRL